MLLLLLIPLVLYIFPMLAAVFRNVRRRNTLISTMQNSCLYRVGNYFSRLSQQSNALFITFFPFIILYFSPSVHSSLASYSYYFAKVAVDSSLPAINARLIFTHTPTHREYYTDADEEEALDISGNHYSRCKFNFKNSLVQFSTPPAKHLFSFHLSAGRLVKLIIVF